MSVSSCPSRFPFGNYGAPWLRFAEGDGSGPTQGTPGAGAGAGTQQQQQPAAGNPPAQEEDKTDWKAEARKWENRAKENIKAAEKLQQIEDEKKSELEKAIARAEKAERERDEYKTRQERRDLAVDVAKAKNIPDAADLLTGSTKEELEASADRLIAFRGNGAGGKPGVVPSTGTGDGTGNKAVSSVTAGRERWAERHAKKQKQIAS